MDEKTIARLMAALGVGTPVDITRLEFSEQGRCFIAYNAEGEGWGGDLTNPDETVEVLKANLLSDVESGALGQHFGIYQAVPADELAEKRGHNTDWADIYNAA